MELSNAHFSNSVLGTSSNREVGMKFKRDEDEGDDDFEWEDASTSGIYYLFTYFQFLNLKSDNFA